VAATLLILHFVLAVTSKRQESTTSDELVHVTGGYSYWLYGDYRLHPENGILPQRWAALPAFLERAKFPSLEENSYWRTNDAWVIGYQFFYETGEDHFPRLMAARMMIALFSVATGLLIFLWSFRLFGNVGALISLTFFAFSPDFLAHGALATSDACMAFFFLACVGAYWRHLHDPRIWAWWLSAVILGLAIVAKYSSVLLLPLIGLMSLMRVFSPEPLVLAGRTFTTRRSKLGAIVTSAIGQGIVAWVIIWAFYGFRYSAVNPDLPAADLWAQSWAVFEKGIGGFSAPVRAARAAHLLPEAFLYGFAYVVKTVAERAAFLNGEYSMTGWRSFFLWTFVLKSTVPTLLAIPLATFAISATLPSISRWRAGLYRATPLILLFAVYWATSLTSHLNIGHRHLLPIYPVLFIGFGALGSLAIFERQRIARVVIVTGLLGWHCISALRIAPHYIAYFNEVSGGPDRGWRHLVDSSVDWGQDLPSLKRWLETHAADEPAYLSYFGTGEPGYYHIKAHRLPFMNNFKFVQNYNKLEPGIYCISATMLQQVYSPFRGPWTAALESEFQTLRLVEPLLDRYSQTPEHRAEFEVEYSSDRWRNAISRLENLRLARLCHYLRVRKPDANVGHSILIYRLAAEEIAGATLGSLHDWSTLIEKAVVASAR
jgi:hypothetical protein